MIPFIAFPFQCEDLLFPMVFESSAEILILCQDHLPDGLQ